MEYKSEIWEFQCIPYFNLGIPCLTRLTNAEAVCHLLRDSLASPLRSGFSDEDIIRLLHVSYLKSPTILENFGVVILESPWDPIKSCNVGDISLISYILI